MRKKGGPGRVVLRKKERYIYAAKDVILQSESGLLSSTCINSRKGKQKNVHDIVGFKCKRSQMLYIVFVTTRDVITAVIGWKSMVFITGRH